MDQKQILERIEQLKAKRVEIQQNANQSLAYLTGQIELLDEMLTEENQPEELERGENA